MQIFVKTLDRTQAVDVSASTTISDLKSQIFSVTGISEDNQTLCFSGSMLEDYLVISEQIPEEATLYLTLGLDGGKKKKKNYTTKKKNKHKHRKETLATLRYYAVDAQGKVSRTRKQCPQCGPGYYMAKHLDRHYCGRCHLTLRLDPAAIKAAQEAYRKAQAEKLKNQAAAVADKKEDAGKGKKGKKK